MRTHGWSGTPTYKSWDGMKQRCRGKKGAASYALKKIGFDSRWLDFNNFLSDMGPRPPGTTLDRIDNSKGYGPENCRWVTMREQNRNHGRNVRLTFNGETKLLSDWARGFGMSKECLHNRLNRYGWDVEKALTKPVRQYTITKSSKET